MEACEPPFLRKSLGLTDLVLLGFNCVIGAGIFTNPGEVAAALGPWGPSFYLLGALICFPIALCFAAMARLEPGTGGACLYARRAFGEHTGFVVGWVMWLSGLIGGAAVAQQLGLLLFPGSVSNAAFLAGMAVIAMMLVNLVGSKGGVWSNNFLATLKLFALGLFLSWLLIHLPWSGLASPPAPTTPGWHLTPMWGLMLVLFSFSGFEEIGLPAGEVRDPQRNVPRALLIVLASSTVIYALVQGAVGCLGKPGSTAPLAEATRAVPWLSLVLTVAGIASVASVNASIAFTCPRSLWALAELGWLPSGLRRLSTRGGPSRCIWVTGLLMLTLVCSSHLEALISLSVLASLLQHLATCLATWKERRWSPAAFAPLAGTLVCAALVLASDRDYLKGMVISIAMGVVLSWASRQKRSSIR
jgi:APA family basic amino acid/polyamine antiporter